MFHLVKLIRWIHITSPNSADTVKAPSSDRATECCTRETPLKSFQYFRVHQKTIKWHHLTGFSSLIVLSSWQSPPNIFQGKTGSFQFPAIHSNLVSLLQTQNALQSPWYIYWDCCAVISLNKLPQKRTEGTPVWLHKRLHTHCNKHTAACLNALVLSLLPGQSPMFILS